MPTRVHFIGVCGTAMATLAAMLKHRGFDVRGSDQDVYPPMSDFLEAEGIPAQAGYRAEHITSDLDFVVVGNAISRGNPELEEVLDRKIRYCSLPEAIREHFLWGARSIVIAGTHGKTTTTSLAGWLLTRGGVDPSMLVGGIARNFGERGASYRMGQGRDFVIEGDEYDSAFFDKTAKFLKYLPDIAVINNVEFDHADIYADVDAVTLAFRRLVNLVPRRGLLVVGADSPRARDLGGRRPARASQTFGLGEDVDWQAHDLEAEGALTRFGVRRGGAPFGRFELPLVGAHNVRNALAAIAVADRGRRQRREHRRGPAAVRRRQAAARGGRHGRRRHRVRRLRASSDGGRRDARGAARGESGGAHLGRLRAAVGVVVPARLPGRLRARVRRRGRSDRRAGVPIDAAGGRAPVGAAARLRPQRPGPVGPRGRVDRRHRQRRSSREHRPGDLVVLMSNGGFGGIHDKLLRALA